MQPHCHNVSGHNIDPRAFSGRVYICLQNKHSPWPREYLLTRMCSAISDLSCYVIIIYKKWGKSESVWGEGAWSLHLHHFTLSLQPSFLFSACSNPPYLLRSCLGLSSRPLLLLQPLLEGPPPCSPPYIFSSFKIQLESPSQKVSLSDSELAQPDHLCPSIYILSSSFSAYVLSSPWLD